MKKRLATVTSLLCALLTLSGCGAHFHEFSQTVVHATCRSTGYTLLVCECGERQYRDETALVAHEYGEWKAYTSSTLLSFGKEHRACLHCGNLEFRDTAMSEEIPSIFLTEDGDFVLVEGTEKTAYQASLQINGSVGEKAEYLLSQVQCQEQEGMSCSAFRLDPCSPDRTYARAATAETLWQSSIDLRRQTGLLPAWIPTEEKSDVILRVFMNGSYLGLYRLLPLKPISDTAVAVIVVEEETSASLFEQAPTFEQDGLSLLSYSGETSDTALEGFGAFSEFVRTSSVEKFREELVNYSELTALMDYFLLNVFFGLPDGNTAGTVWSSADGVHWTPSFGSLNNAFGLAANGYQNTALDGIPFESTKETEESILLYSGKNLLWQKLCQAFPQELMNRYKSLRDNFLTKENICTLYLDAYESINDDLRKLERDLYPVLPDAAWSARHVESYVENRLKNMDKWLYPKKV